MTPEQAVEKVRQDKGLSSRYPVRLIFVDQFAQYKTITNSLSAICDETVNLADFCGGPDSYPDFAKLQALLQQRADKQILVLGMGEYLRLAFRREQDRERCQLVSLWKSQQDVISKARFIFPLYACYDLWERVVREIDERQIDHIWKVDPASLEQDHVEVTVFSNDFLPILPVSDTSQGIVQWLNSWENLVEQHAQCRIVTKLYRNVESSSGIYEIHVVKSPFDYLHTQMADASCLKQEWGTDSQWGFLAKHCTEQTKCLRDLILHLLNMESFSAVPVLSIWDSLSPEKQWLLWLWYQIFPSKGYIGHVISQVKSLENIPHDIYFSLLNSANRPEAWRDERYEALVAMRYLPQEEELQKAFENIQTCEEKISLLLCNNHVERTYAVATVERWLTIGGAPHTIAHTLKAKFPMLAAYLDLQQDGEDNTVSYFNAYRRAKLQGNLPDDANERSASIALENYSSRYNALKAYENRDSFILWVDALGAEWLPCLYTLSGGLQNGRLTKSEITQAILPTETCFNDAWHSMDVDYKKLDALDKLAHSGRPDEHSYHSCLDSEFNFIESLLPVIDEKLRTYPNVIVTGDHGTSRLAALAFHKYVGTPLPEKAIAKSLGRYCELGQPYDLLRDSSSGRVELTKLDGKEYLVMRDYEHYKQSGKAVSFDDNDTAMIGELHGGATPEEALVPVMVFTSSKVKHRIISFTLPQGTTWKREHGTVTVSIQLDANVETLMATISSGQNDCHAICQKVDTKKWTLRFDNVFLGQAQLSVAADGLLLPEVPYVKIVSAGITRNDDLFGDL